MTIALTYIPVLHQGYLQYLKSQSFSKLLLLSPEVMPESIEYLKKELRAVSVVEMVQVLTSLNIVPQVEVATVDSLRALAAGDDQLVLPDEDISRAVVEHYQLRAANPGRITYSPIFLRWDKKTATEDKIPSIEQEITVDEMIQTMFDKAYREAGKSSDWWRHVGAVVVKDGQPLLTGFNKHQPNEQQQYFDGDARALFSAGQQIEFTSAIHAEASLIAQAARAGIALDESELYVTTFPCPPCAKLIGASGIKKLYFAEGYAVFDGEKILKAANIEVIKVNVEHSTKSVGDSRSTVVSYPSA